MRWPDATREPRSRLRVRTKVVFVVVDEATGLPPAVSPAMRMQRLEGGNAVELDWRSTVTLGGAVVFSGHMDVDGAPQAESYRLIVEADAALRPELPLGYEFTVGANPASWPVRLVVGLLPGPAYTYLCRLPVVHGLVIEAGAQRPPVADAIVVASEDGGMTVSARCGADHRGSFSLGVPRYRPSRPMSVRASAPDGAVSPWQVLTPRDFSRSVQLTIRR